MAKKPLPIADKRHKAISQFVSIPKPRNKKKRAAWARKVKKVFEDLEPVIAREHGVYKGKSAKTLKTAAKATGLDPSLKWKVIPYANNGDPKVKLRVRGNKVVKVDPYAIEHIIPFDQARLAKEGEAYVNRLVRRYPSETEFTVNNGPYTMDGFPQHSDFIGPYVGRLMMEYGRDNKHHYWKQWLHGLTVYEATNQEDVRTYLRKRHNKRKTKTFKQTQRQRKEQWFKKHGL